MLIQLTSMFGAEVTDRIDFCDNNLCFIDKEKLLPDSFTFVSQVHAVRHTGSTIVLQQHLVNQSHLTFLLLMILFVQITMRIVLTLCVT